MEMIYFTVVAVILYLASDWILNQIEIKRGERLQNRSLIFFIIIATLAFVSFSFIQSLYKKPDTVTGSINNTTEQIQQQTPTQ